MLGTCSWVFVVVDYLFSASFFKLKKKPLKELHTILSKENEHGEVGFMITARTSQSALCMGCLGQKVAS